jgi:hypothetical protein
MVPWLGHNAKTPALRAGPHDLFRLVADPARKGRVGVHANTMMWVRPQGGRGRVEP